ncbi:hypothetical protein CK203_033137 [Vitis vinifera]|uniref:Uncharacterized protein n=1 Tax=Vitis vinifera TaxID=29760 RepID=A0A438G0E3_VITVI|nr:hypothetical protein CK203_033137 [Vitis vinifera]
MVIWIFIKANSIGPHQLSIHDLKIFSHYKGQVTDMDGDALGEDNFIIPNSYFPK